MLSYYVNQKINGQWFIEWLSQSKWTVNHKLVQSVRQAATDLVTNNPLSY